MDSEPVQDDVHAGRSANSISAPLRVPLFRRIWLASVLSNFGLMILSVSAAWSMTQLTSAADMIALVQSAIMLPIMLLAVPAGAIADMYDRRRVSLVALSISLLGSAGLSLLTASGHLSPWLLLLFCFIVGGGMALFWPAWQASVSEQVPMPVLPQAVALNSISFNIARSIGPAVGGMIVAGAGAFAAFLVNALLYIPLLIVFLLWRRKQEPSRLPPERLFRAISSGVRYVLHSPSIRTVLTRTFAFSLAGGAVLALMPVVARDLLQGSALVYGIILGAFGVGGVISALNIGTLRNRFDGDKVLAVCAALTAAMIAVVGLSTSLLVTALALLVVGASWMISVTFFNITVQMAVPRWVSGRTLATFQTAMAGGIAIGSWLWGHVADWYGVSATLLASAACMALTILLGRWFRMPSADDRDQEPVELDTPPVALALTGRSGPIVVELEYRVDAADARTFYGVMQQIQQVRHRNGAYNWSIARDIADPELWTERYHCPTWHDYLRVRGRYTAADVALQDRAYAFHRGPEPVRIHRMLERPFGSVRWQEDAPDRGTEVLPIATPLANG
ncbi:MAG: MFS transporter [Sphingomonadaceae bacterium]